MVAKKKTAKKATPRKTTKKKHAGRMSQLEAAAKVLAEAGVPMSCPEMIEVMAEKGYWSSPAGKTPASTLYASLLRQIQKQDSKSRFRKVARGMFALRK